VIDLAAGDDPPRRLLLGSDAYTLVTSALTDHLNDFETRKDLASSTDYDDFQPPA
jgi:hypothetical protein